MRICIHRGTREIGGTCIELASGDQHLVLDVGLPLDADSGAAELPQIGGLTATGHNLLGVCISHPHLDHYGLARRLPAEVPILMGEAAQRILAAAAVFMRDGYTFERVVPLKDRKPVVLGPFTLTPFLVDHSAFDAYAVLVEADGRRVFYTGDLRGHGRKRGLFQRMLRHPPEGVDVLLMEGTTLGRFTTDGELESEDDLEQRLREVFAATAGMPLVWCSGQNIDRLVTVFKACRKAKRILVLDMYTAHVLRATGRDSIPQAEWDDIVVFLPSNQKRQIVFKKAFDIARSYRASRVFPEDLADLAAKAVMLFRPSMIPDVEEHARLDGSCLVYSMWSGYYARAETAPLREWVERRGMPVYHCHTSGHAGLADLKRLAAAIEPKALVPIHSQHPELFAAHFSNVVPKEDGGWWEVP